MTAEWLKQFFSCMVFIEAPPPASLTPGATRDFSTRNPITAAAVVGRSRGWRVEKYASLKSAYFPEISMMGAANNG